MADATHPVLQDAAERILRGVGPGDPPPGVGLTVRIGAHTVSAVAGTRRGRPGDADAQPMTQQTQHDLASVTKVAATTSVLMRLVDQGDLSLSDTVRSYLPGFRDGGKDAITISQLLLHRAGLWEWRPLYLNCEDRGAAARLLDELPLRYPPDQSRHYSDLGFMVLGRIVEAVTTTSIDIAFRELICRPLALETLTFASPADLDGDVAASSHGDAIERRMIQTGVPYPVPGHLRRFSGWRTHELQGEVNDGNAHHVFGGVAGHAGLFGSLPDLARLGVAFAGAELVGTDIARAFFAPGPDDGQARGFRVYRAGGLEFRGHTGFTGSALVFVPGRGISLAMATNRLHHTTTVTPVETMLAAALDALTAILKEHQLEDLP